LIPQLSKELGLIGALAALWASGDFALSSLVAYQDLTVAMLVDELMSSYRLELATWLMAPMLLAGFGCGALFLGAGYVTSRKFSSGLR
jgi:thiamine transport system permease protein